MFAVFAVITAAAFLAGTVFATSGSAPAPRGQFDLFSIQSAEAVVDATGGVEIFAKFDGILGESVASGHQNQIDISSYRFDFNQDPDPISSVPEGDPIFRDFVLVKRLDKSSPMLFIKAVSEDHIKTVEVSVRKVGSSVDFLKFKLTDVQIKSFGDNSQGNYPYEAVTLEYSTIQIDYQPLKPDGTADGAPIKKAWDLKGNKELPAA